ncbi:LOW QUALITY PROTEIN: hypothetical protein HID58_046085 [Brassica napus]|uniref:Uncharacterized protein n=1 Tax=Brassica napus TaxID=3708 RepID=A0ABQ8AVJ0_BRANA|nr:LOW QUALITY PROTEIN: hypothetical protein HID58_046085 [Brassica napus]
MGAPKKTLETTQNEARRFDPRPHPRFKSPPVNQPKIHRDTSTLTSSTNSSPRTLSTQNQSVNRDLIRLHASPELERKLRRNITLKHQRASITRAPPSNPAQNHINKDNKKPNPKTELGNPEPATQGKEHLHPPETRAGDKASTFRKPSRRRWNCRSLHLPETKPNMASQFHHAKPSTRSRRYSSRSATNDDGSLPKLSTADGDWTKAPIRRPGREGGREAGGLSLSEERRAPATARSLTRRPYAGLKGRSTFFLSLSLL